jgi:hypothetical protein
MGGFSRASCGGFGLRVAASLTTLSTPRWRFAFSFEEQMLETMRRSRAL